ncbi:DUF262 domain-containing protein [Paenibacillus sp. FA6]|uniref:DUF262 domain-containing protein n=1 Tax=Paenibacillus sp. FA6 TaxID=3413029 RepID=UPI003F65EF97
MRLIPSDPDIRTIVSRIFDGDINLQPNFQRGEVWGEVKKVRLIDSILREWHVPPIHVVEIKESGKQDVLDGQQRLVAIRDFVNGDISIDGNIEPLNEDIMKLDGNYYNDLPDFWRRRFDKFTLRVYSITDYLPSEPGELFFRLNQPTNLTSAEQRNAFYGPAREQVKLIVEFFHETGLTRKDIGFSNSRMAYDDVVARLCLYLDAGSLMGKVTSNVLADKFRDESGFSDYAVNKAKKSLELFSVAVGYFDTSIRFNKATLLSWLIFLTQIGEVQVKREVLEIGNFIYSFETSRNSYKLGHTKFDLPSQVSFDLFNLFSDRSSSRVADVSSILIRDAVIWICFRIYSRGLNLNIDNNKLNKVDSFIGYIIKDDVDRENALLNYIDSSEWGVVL